MFEFGAKFPLFITLAEADTPLCHIWAQTDFDGYAKVEALLQDAGNRNDRGVPDINKLSVGDLCLAKYHLDGNWYRAQVLEINKSAATVEVSFMDFGNVEKLSVQDLVNGAPVCFSHPPLAVKFTVADIQPGNECSWTENEKKYLIDYLSNQELHGEVLHAGTVGCPPTLRLFEAADSSAPFVNKFVNAMIGRVYNNSHIRCGSVARTVLEPGQQHQVYVTFSRSPVDFWIQAVDAEERLDALHAEIEQYLNNDASSVPSLQQGMLCIAKYAETESFYRGVVKKYVKNEGSCEVLFIDYGNSDVVPVSDVHVLPSKLCSLPAQAVQCTLSGEAVRVANFEQLVECDNLHAKILTVLDSGVYVVVLSTGTVPSQVSQSQTMTVTSSQRHIQDRPMASYMPIQFNVGCRHEVCVCHVEDSGYFFVQLLENRYLLDACMEQIVLSSLTPFSKASLQAGSACLAKSPTDNVLYRGQVQSKTQLGVEVKYVDFGVVEMLKADAIFQISSQFMELPSQALFCSLTGTDHLPPSQVVDLLKQYESNTTLMAKVLLRSGHMCEMEMLDDVNGQPVSLSELAKKGVTVNGSIVKPAEVAIGSIEKLYVTTVNSDAEFFGQLAKYSAETLDSFQAKLNDFYQGRHKVPLDRLTTGQFCCTMFSQDGSYYRAQVLKTSGADVQVAFLDYGNQELKQPSDLLVLDPKFGELPQQGISCFLSDFYNNLTQADLEAWLLEQEVIVQLRQTRARGFSVTFPDCPENAFLLPQIKSHESKEAKKLLGHSSSATRSLSSASTSSAGSTSVKPPSPAYTPQDLRGGMWAAGIITFVESPEHFYMQLESSHATLETLMAQIQEYCRQLGPGEGCLAGNRLTLGTPVLALYSEDGSWYRGLVTGILASGKAEVKYVDYGNGEQVQAESLKAMNPQFMNTPMQAIRCGLKHVFCSGSAVWSQTDIDAFYSCTERDSLMVYFDSLHEVEERWDVELFDGVASINQQYGTNTGRLSSRFQTHGPPPATVTNAAAPPTHSTPSAVSNQAPCLSLKLPQLDLQLEEYVDVCVVFSISPGQFWCSLHKKLSQLEKLMDDMNAYYGALGASDLAIGQLQPGDICCARFSDDDMWYRAEVVSLQNSCFKVKFVDYGNEEEVSPNRVKLLKETYTSLPEQAFPCTLFGAKPVSYDWSEAAMDKFSDLTIDKKLVGCLTEKSSEGAYIVELIDIDQPVHETMINAGLAAGTEEPVVPATRGGRVQARRSSAASSSSTSSRASSASKQADLKYKEVEVKMGHFSDVSVSYSSSPSSFWCQLTEGSTKLEELMTQLDKDYTNLRPTELALTNPEANQVCCAKYTEDDNWYRGLILKVDGGQCLVKFVDYGNDETTTSSRLKLLSRQHISLPIQAFKCGLHGIDCQTGSWSDEHCQKFEDLTLDKHMIAKVLSKNKDGTNMISLVDVSGDAKIVINDVLVKTGMAIRAGSPITLNTKEKTQAISPLSPPVKPLSQMFKVMDIPVGQQKLAVASWMNSPAEFFCQLAQSEENVMKLSESLFNSYNDLRLNDLSIARPQVGQLCVAHYVEDGNWYRGQIVGTDARDADVFYADYGNVEKIPLSKVKLLKEEYLELPCQALRCELYGAEDLQGKYPPDLMSKLQEAVAVPFMLTVVDKVGDINTVKLTDEQGRDISETVGLVKPAVQATPAAATTTAQPMKQPAEFSYKDLDLLIGKTSLVQVSHVEDAHHFYCQLVDNLTELEGYMDKLGTRYADAADLGLTSLAVDAPCVAQYTEDDMWYRAVIIKKTSASDVEVLFIDYGNSETLPTSRVRRLDAEFTHLPAQAFRCSLSGIPTSLPPDSATVFEELATATAELNCTIDKKQGKNYAVTLVVPGGASISDEIISKYGTEKTSEAPASAPAAEPGAKFAQPEIPKETVDVYVTAATSPSQFYVQPCGKETLALDLAEKLLAEYDALSVTERALSNVAVGQACIAKFTEDEAWYRAYVSEISAEGATVHFIDYGNSDVVPMTNLKLPTADYLSQPATAIECRLDVSVPSGGWTDADVAKLNEVTGEGAKLLQAEFLGSTEPCTVRLLDGTDDLAKHFKEATKEASPEKESESVDVAAADVSSESEQKEIVVTDWSGAVYPEWTYPASKTQVYVSHIESPAEVYLQIVRQETELQELMDKVEEKCAEDNHKMAAPQRGQPCCARYTQDNVWYRALVKEVLGNNAFAVQFVDYGNTEKTSGDNLTELVPDLFEPAPMALLTSLKNVVKPSAAWPDDVIDQLHEMTTDKVLSAEFDAESKPCLVQLNDKDVNINEKVVALLGPSEDAEEEPAEVAALDVKDLEVTAPDVKDVEVTAPEVKDLEVTAPDVKDLEVTAPEVKDSEAKDSEAKEPEVAEAAQHFPLPEIPAENVSVYVSSVESPSQFYLQFASKDAEMQDFVSRVSDFYTNDSSLSGLETFERDQICCAKYSEDQLWYRGLIRSQEDEDSCTILFVDYGNVELVTKQDIKKLTADFSGVPPYALECHLAGFDQSMEWTEEDITKFSDSTSEKELTAKFVSQTETSPFAVELCDGDTNLKSLFEDKPSTEAADSSTPQDTSDKTDVVDDIPDVKEVEPVSSVSDSTDAETATVAETDKAAGDSAETSTKPEILEETETSSVPEGSRRTVKVGDKFEVYLSHTETPAHFWCQLVEEEDALHDLMEDLSVCYSGTQANATEFEPTVGQLCAAKYSDGEWYRARVLSDSADGSTVHFIDYGNSDTVLKTDMTKLRPALAQPASYATECVLSGVKPTGESAAAWCEAAQLKFEELTAEKKLLAEVVALPENGQGDRPPSLAVNLLDMGQCVAKSLIDEGLAEKSDELVLPVETQETARASSLSPGPSQLEQQQEIDKKEVQEVSQNLDFSESTGQAEEAEFDFSKDVETLERVKLVDKSRVEVYTSHVISPSQFWVQLKSGQTDLDELEEVMARCYGDDAKEVPKPPGIVPGLYVAAKSSEDDAWYRAQVTEIAEDDVTVQYVDYGNSEQLPTTNIRQLSTTLAKSAAQAIECMLDGVRSPGCSWTDEASELFTSLTTEKCLMVELAPAVDPSGGLSPVRLLDMGLSIADKLVEAGMAVDNSKPVYEPSKKSEESRETEQEEKETSEETEEKVEESETNDNKANEVQPENNEQPSYKFISVAAGDEVEVYITHAESPHDFWCQLELSSTNELPLLMDEIYDHYSALEEKDETLSEAEVSMPCIARYLEDGSWYRGQITHIDDDKLHILFVDYGNNQVSEKSLVKVIKSSFTQLPCQAFRCRLHNVKPCSGSGETWDEASINRFTELANNEVKLMASVKDVRMGSQGSIEVAELELQNNGDSVAQQLVDGGYAHFCKEPSREAKEAVKASVTEEEQNAGVAQPQASCSENQSKDEEQVLAQATGEIPAPEEQIVENQADSEGVAEDGAASSSASAAEQDSATQAAADENDSINNTQPTQGDSNCSSQDLNASQPAESSLCDHDTLKGAFVEGLSPIRPSTPVERLVEEEEQDLAVNGERPPRESLRQRLRRVSMERQGFCLPDIELGTTVRVNYICGETPADFALQYADTSSDLKSMMENIATHCKNTTQEEEEECSKKRRPSIGRRCLAMYPDDNSWYRAVVTAEQPNAVEVKFVDFGHKAIVKSEDIQTLENDFTELPVQAIPCYLAGIESAKWTDESHRFFESLCQDKDLNARLVSQSEDGAYAVYLYDIQESTEESINYRLVTQGYASVIPGSELDLQPHGERPADDLENSFLDVSMQRANSMGTFGDDSDVESSEDQVYTYAKFHEGEELEILMLSCKDPDNIVCMQTSGSQPLDDLMAKLAETYEDSSLPSLETPQSGQPCCAKFSEDNAWYRGRILSVGEDTTSLNIYYVDYGNEEVLASSEVKLLDQEFLSLPAQAVQCRLAGVRTGDEGWPEEAGKLLEETCCGETDNGEQMALKAVVVSIEADGTLIVDIKTSQDQDVSELLLKKGLASKDSETEPPPQPAESQKTEDAVNGEDTSEDAEPIVATDETFGALVMVDDDSGLSVSGGKSSPELATLSERTEDSSVLDEAKGSAQNGAPSKEEQVDATVES